MLMNKKVLYISVFIISFLVIFAGLYWFLIKSKSDPLKRAEITVGSQTFSVEIADSLKSRARGLSGHAPLGDTMGMYFSFPIKAKYSFWMKDMAYPLDIIWIADGKVLGVSENVPVPQNNNILNLPTYSPPEAIDSALEINAGSVKKFNISIGDIVSVDRQKP